MVKDSVRWGQSFAPKRTCMGSLLWFVYIHRGSGFSWQRSNAPINIQSARFVPNRFSETVFHPIISLTGYLHSENIHCWSTCSFIDIVLSRIGRKSHLFGVHVYFKLSSERFRSSLVVSLAYNNVGVNSLKLK